MFTPVKRSFTQRRQGCKEDKIGISAAHPKLREAFPVNFKQGIYFTINAVPFCRHFGIRLDRTEAFVDPDIDNQEILLLDLRTTRHAFGGKRRLNKLRAEAA